jgi:hypothetical protein
VLLCASGLRFGWGQGAEPLVRLAADCGFRGIAVGAHCAQRDLAQLISQIADAGLAVPIVASPLGETSLPAGRRLPYLGAVEDVDERLTAVKLVGATWSAASALGVTSFTLDMGTIRLHGAPPAVAFRFARRELDEDEPGERLWADVLSERRARSPDIVDACRDSLDRLLPQAEKAGLQVAMEVTGPWGTPTPREAAMLLDEYRGAPISIVWDEARTQAFAGVGIGLGSERRARLAESVRVLRCQEAVGIETGFAPGLGDPDGTGDWSATLPPLVIVGGRPDTTVAEMTRARATVEARAARG